MAPMSTNDNSRREYQRQRRHERLALARERLGGRCIRCGATQKLQFDHIDRAAKVANISEITSWSLDRFRAEVDKCQLLCARQVKAVGSAHVAIAGCGDPAITLVILSALVRIFRGM